MNAEPTREALLAELDGLRRERRASLNMMRDAQQARAEAQTASVALATANETLRRAQWLQEGHTRVAIALVGAVEPAALADTLLRTLARALGAQVGVLYFADSLSEGFEVAAVFALDAPRHAGRVVRLGEGLIGQAAVEGRPLLVEVPPGYLQVASGLGATTPGQVLVVPFLLDGVVKGVAELGALAPFYEGALELMALVEPHVALAIDAALGRQVTHALLLETERQREELASRTAELERTNEQLVAQSRVVTEQKEALEQRNRALLAAYAEIEVKATALSLASQYKSEFLANMSHELRTPLNSLLLLSRDLAERDSDGLRPDQAESVRFIFESSQNLQALIDQILDLSKIEAGQMETTPQRFPVAEVIHACARELAPVARGTEVAFEVEQDPAVGEVVSDRLRVTQILRNLLSNAFKFTRAGSVRLRVSQRGDPPGIVFEVTDTGIGIPPDKLGTIFEAFRQVDGSITRRFGGTGLGLAISNRLAQLLGGEITVDSVLGRGSTFSLILPVEPADAAVETPPRPSVSAIPRLALREERREERQQPRIEHDLRGHRVLLVEDDLRSAFALSGLLGDRGMEVVIAEDGGEALRRLGADGPFDVMLVDVMMPGIDGLEVVRRLRTDDAFASLPVVAVTARAMDSDRSACLESGADAYFPKPVDLDGLLSTLHALLHREAPNE